MPPERQALLHLPVRVDYLLSYQCAEVSAVRIRLVGLSCIRLPRACLGTNLLHGHCRTYCKLLLRERCSRNLEFVTLQTVKHIHIHFPEDASDDDVLAVLKDASARVE